MRIAILGAGAWGTALAVHLAARHSVTLYVRDPTYRATLEARRENVRYLPGVPLPETLEFSAQLAPSVAGADLVLVATPVAGLRATLAALAPLRPLGVVWLCKGMEAGTGLLPHQIAEEELSGIPGGALFGPSFAAEVAAGLPVALTVAASDAVLADRVVAACHDRAVRVYRSFDLIGVEVGGAVKNVIAIATGVADGLELGHNARAALITRGLSEMMRLGAALGAQPQTLMGLTGVGDLILTCTGALSRNRRVGIALGQGQALPEILAGLGHVAEGVSTVESVIERARRLGIEMPISQTVFDLLSLALTPRAAVSALLARSPTVE